MSKTVTIVRLAAPQGGSGTAKPQGPPPAAKGRPKTLDVEVNFPATADGVQRIIEVEAATEAEAVEILTNHFRRGLRVVKRV